MNGVCLSRSRMQQVQKLRQSTGKVGKESAAAKFATATPSNEFSIEEEKPYAEVCH